jgi:hypothetical protein
VTGGGVGSETVQLERVSYGLPPKKKRTGKEGRGGGGGGGSRSEGGLVFGAFNGHCKIEYADVCWHVLTYADVCRGVQRPLQNRPLDLQSLDANFECLLWLGGLYMKSNMLTFADVC